MLPQRWSELGDVDFPILRKQAHYVCIAHCCAMRPGDDMDPSIGDEVARYILVYADGSQHSLAMRRRYSSTFSRPQLRDRG